MNATSIEDLKHELKSQSCKAIEKAYKLGQSEDVTATKAELEETLKHAQEAYEFYKVVMNRFCIPENHLESTTKSYLREIGNQLGQIKGIKKMTTAIQFIQQHGVDKAREVVEGAPDKTASHYVFRKIPNYYSVEFQSWYHDGEWWDSDCHTEQDLIDSYGLDFVLGLTDLKRLVLRLDLIDRLGGINKASELFVKYQHLGESCFQEYLQCSSRTLEQAIADYEALYPTGGAK